MPYVLRPVIFLSRLAILLSAASIAMAHPGNPLLPEGCGSCHVGHGVSSEPMLPASEEEMCFKCHGSETARSEAVASGILAPGATLYDIEAEFNKAYRHPVKEGTGHSATEELPSPQGNAISHSECVDCHNPHQRIVKGMSQVADVSGYSLSGQRMKEAVYEYEICLKCHSDITGGPESSKDIQGQFATSVRSMHPVSRPATGVRQESLYLSQASSANMKCSDCHRSGDQDGPRGPHGSSYRYLLSGNYDTDPEADESPLAYEFCYSCHDRQSILSNESFPLHAEHIQGDLIRNIPGTSCYTCHASHSSQDNPFLIEFNREAVSRSRQTGQIEYISLGVQSGRCYLTCHDYSHDPAEY